MSHWNSLTDAQKIAHNTQVAEVAQEMRAAEAAAHEACKHLTPGFPASWREDSALVTARAADAAFHAAFERHSALLYKFAA